MSTQTIIERPLVSGLSGGKSASRIKRSWKKVLSRRTPIMIGITGFVILGMAAFYFWGNGTSATQYMTARVERGNLRNTVTATGTLQAVTTGFGNDLGSLRRFQLNSSQGPSRSAT
jgi:multidrug efflux pump subunit AcrA (membrane-fusion protein)